jgi:GT2 family glycosyltransferase
MTAPLAAEQFPIADESTLAVSLKTEALEPISAPTAKTVRGLSRSPRRVWAVIPCFNRQKDLALLLDDLARLVPPAVEAGIAGLDVLVIDNSSTPAIEINVAKLGSDAASWPMRIEVLRLETNPGGSGGFNAGLSRAIAASTSPDDLLWLVDSDARVEPGALAALVEALDADPSVPAAGSALVDPESGAIFELGGRIDPRTGEMVQPLPEPMPTEPVEVEYLAACSLLVRRWAAEGAGLMADVFLNGDDAEWCLRLTAVNGRRPIAVPSSRVRHPRPDRMRTWPRYYSARNAMAILARQAALGIGGSWGPARAWLRAKRAMREVARGCVLVLTGRDDLARLHVRGLRDAADGRFGASAHARQGLFVERPLDELPSVVRSMQTKALIGGSLSGAMRDRVRALLKAERLVASELDHTEPSRQRLRLISRAWDWLVGKTPALAIVSARSRSADALLARTLITISEGPAPTYTIQQIAPIDRLMMLARVVGSGLVSAARLAIWPNLAPAAMALRAARWTPGPATLSVVILSFNRWQALEHTLRKLASMDMGQTLAEILVVDNASSDGTAEKIRGLFPDVRLIALDRNLGIEGFNIGAREARGELLLILDDDSWPEPSALRGAIGLLEARRDLQAVALHPRHPKTHVSEWPFVPGVKSDDSTISNSPTPSSFTTDAWPFMGCGNLVRREAWLRVGGYQSSYFLYRNDTDLALTLLGEHATLNGGGLGGVHFNPAWVVWHDSPAAARKSRRWFELATRNWCWLCRRHGHGLLKWRAMLAGWGRAHYWAGGAGESGGAWRNLGDHLAVMRGVWAGLISHVNKGPRGGEARGSAGLKALWRVKRGRVG